MSKKESRNAKGSGMIRKRPDGRWEARYTIGIDPGTGKQLRRSVYGSTQAEVRRKLTEAACQIDNGSYIEPSKYHLAQWLEIWLSDYTGNIKPYTLDTYTRNIKNHIKPALGNARLTELNAVMIQQFINNMAKPKVEGGKGLAPKTVKNVAGTLHCALDQAARLGFIASNPASACKLPRCEKVAIRPLHDEEITYFLQAIKGHRFETLFLVDLFTGMRQGEILGLGWDSIDFKKGNIRIYRQLQQRQIKGDFNYYFASLKNDKPRVVVPAPFIMQRLKAQKCSQMETRMRVGELWNNEYDLVFTDEFGHCLSRRTVYKQFKTLVANIGLPETRFHDLRHSFATMSLQSGVDIKTLSETLGHYSAAFTLDVYADSTDRMKHEAANKMEAFAKGIVNL